MSSTPPPLPGTPDAQGVPVLPYATALPYQGPGPWRQGNLLVIAKGVGLPHACVKCNETEGVRMIRKTVYWHSPSVYLLILLTGFLYVIVAAIIRQSVTFSAGLCPRHRRRHALNLAIAWTLVPAGIIAMIWGLGLSAISGMFGEFPWFPSLVVLVGFILMIVGVVWGMIGSRILTAKKIDGQFAWLRGCCWAYLEPLPPAP